LRRQLPEAFQDLLKQVEKLPEILEELQKQAKEFRKEQKQKKQEQRDLKEDTDEDSTSDSSGQVQEKQSLRSVIKSLRELATDEEKQRELKEEAKDLLRSTPKGLETPSYEVVRVLEGPPSEGPRGLDKPRHVEIRGYEEFTVAQTNMKGIKYTGGFASSSEGGGFNTLASYLFGENEGKTAMKMTAPVDTSSDGDESRAKMSFVLPKEFADSPPTPLEGSNVEIVKVPARLVAAQPFSGLVTGQEVERQKAALLEALERDGNYAPVDVDQVSVLQYNAPIAIPWRRRNEVAIVVTKNPNTDPNLLDLS